MVYIHIEFYKYLFFPNQRFMSLSLMLPGKGGVCLNRKSSCPVFIMEVLFIFNLYLK